MRNNFKYVDNFRGKSMDEQHRTWMNFCPLSGDKALIEERFITSHFKASLIIVAEKVVLNFSLGNGLIAEYVTDIAKKQVIVEGSPEIIENFLTEFFSSEVVLKYLKIFRCRKI